MNNKQTILTIAFFAVSIALMVYALIQKENIVQKPKAFEDIKQRILGDFFKETEQYKEPIVKIEDIKIGDGKTVKIGDTIKVNYKGTLEDGTIFDTNEGAEPLEFELKIGGLIQGWIQGIPGMREGGVRKLTIPSELGYGEQQVGNIPANSTLIFEVELIEVIEK